MVIQVQYLFQARARANTRDILDTAIRIPLWSVLFSRNSAKVLPKRGFGLLLRYILEFSKDKVKHNRLCASTA